MTPVIRTKHSKKASAEEIVTHFPKGSRRFVEVLTTDASVFLKQPRSPKLSVLNFTDPDLAHFYRELSGNPDRVITAAEELWEDTSVEEFQSLQMADAPDDPAEAAAQTLYLNQLSTPGTARFDKARPFPRQGLQELASSLEGVKVMVTDPIQTLFESRPTDLLFFDSSMGEWPAEEIVDISEEVPGLLVLCAPESSGLDGCQLETRRPGSREPDILWVKPHGGE